MKEVSNYVAIVLILIVAAAVLFYVSGCKIGCEKKIDKFERTCMTADRNCKFVRSPVDYAFVPITDIPERKGLVFPHLLGNTFDKAHPLEEDPIKLIKDEDLLWNQNKLWKQYENDYKGCGNGKTHIVNDDKTRFALTESGDEYLVRLLNAQGGEKYGPRGNQPALTDLDMIVPDPFGKAYGGAWLNDTVGS